MKVKPRSFLIDRLQHIRNLPNGPRNLYSKILAKNKDTTVHTEAQTTAALYSTAPTPAERRQIASHHAALFPTRLALARWQHGGALPHLHPGFPALRAAWYGTARSDFQSWLECGGFTQHEDAALPAPPEPSSSIPLDTSPRPLGSCI